MWLFRILLPACAFTNTLADVLYLPGGAAGAVSRITGTLGKGLAAVTMDSEYQQKRREKLNREPATASEGFARGVKGLGMVKTGFSAR